ncbi:MAG TPA: hypothetical protein VHG53_00150 [Candidatus Limnocylindria bacterium]|nr:hypothetical protein [Candidatus Limnocylindria bacterium]
MFKRILPGAVIERNLRYRFERDGKYIDGELDGLVAFGPVLILIEAKSGPVSHAALRGATESLRQDLRNVIGDAYGQATKARGYILGQELVTFIRPDGSECKLRRSDFSELYLTTASLESLDVFVMRLAQLQELGILAAGEHPWAVSLLDLEVFADLIEWGPQFIHYLRRRVPLNQLSVFAMEELDLLGAYLENGLRLPPEAALGAPVHLTTHTEKMDDYYHYRHGIRMTPADPPRMNLHQRSRDAVATANRQEDADALNEIAAILDAAFPRS